MVGVWAQSGDVARGAACQAPVRGRVSARHDLIVFPFRAMNHATAGGRVVANSEAGRASESVREFKAAVPRSGGPGWRWLGRRRRPPWRPAGPSHPSDLATGSLCDRGAAADA
jgi:hypothetical protein